MTAPAAKTISVLSSRCLFFFFSKRRVWGLRMYFSAVLVKVYKYTEFSETIVLRPPLCTFRADRDYSKRMSNFAPLW